jgi:hypothetical protein
MNGTSTKPLWRILSTLAVCLVPLVGHADPIHPSEPAPVTAVDRERLAIADPEPKDDSHPPSDLPASLTTDDVLAMMRKLPSKELGHDTYRWDKVGQANRIASAIAKAATTRDEAGDLTVYAIYESNLLLAAIGDGGKSYGPWQLTAKYATIEVATRNPEKAAAIWLAAAAQSRKDCEKLPEDDRLAEVASGSCDYGRTLARRRARLRRQALTE